MEANENRIAIPGDAEGLRSKRKFGKKGMGSAKMKITTLRSDSEGNSAPSVFDLARDKENIDQLLQVQKTRRKNPRKKGLGARTKSSTHSKVAQTGKARKKRRSLTMDKRPDSESDEGDDDDDASEASRKPRHKKSKEEEWVQPKAFGTTSKLSHLMNRHESRRKNTPKQANSTNKRRTPAPQKFKGPLGPDPDDSDAGSVGSVASIAKRATMRLSASMSIGRDSDIDSDVGSVPQLHRFRSRAALALPGSKLSPVRDAEEWASEEDSEEREVELVPHGKSHILATSDEPASASIIPDRGGGNRDGVTFSETGLRSRSPSSARSQSIGSGSPTPSSQSDAQSSTLAARTHTKSEGMEASHGSLAASRASPAEDKAKQKRDEGGESISDHSDPIDGASIDDSLEPRQKVKPVVEPPQEDSVLSESEDSLFAKPLAGKKELTKGSAEFPKRRSKQPIAKRARTKPTSLVLRKGTGGGSRGRRTSEKSGAKRTASLLNLKPPGQRQKARKTSATNEDQGEFDWD